MVGKKRGTIRYMKMLVYCLLGYALFTATVYAQTEMLAPDVSIETIPANPAPESTVTVRIISYGLDLPSLPITWRYGGAVVASGTGKTQIAVTAPKSGESATVTASVGGDNPTAASLTVRPGSVDILWEATDAYVPPFYKGKAPLAIGGTARFVAIPAPRAPNQLSYVWSQNGTVVSQASTTSVSSIPIKNSILNPSEAVAVSVRGGVFAGEQRVRVTPTRPIALAYNQRDGFIDYANGFDADIAIVGEGAVIRFEPYFFSMPTGRIAGDLAIGMTIDEEPVASDASQNVLRLSRPTDGGTHSLNLSISTVAYSLQNLQKTFSLLFQ